MKMNKSQIKQSSLIVAILFFYMLFQLPFLSTITSIMVDESWYANVAYNFSIGNGLIETATGSHTGAGQEMFIYTGLLGIFFKIFGTSLFSARLFSVISGLIALIGFIGILKKLNVNNLIIMFSSILFIVSNVNYIIFRTVRPDGILLMFAIWAFYFLLTSINTLDSHYMIPSGLLSAVSFLCHPHGAFYILIIGAVAVYFSYKRNKLSYIFYFIIGCLPIFIWFFVYLFNYRYDYFNNFIGFISSRSAIDQGLFFPSILYKITHFTERYTIGIKRLFILLCEIGVLVIGLFYFKKDRKIFFVSLCGVTYFLMAFMLLRTFATRHFGEVLIFSFVAFSVFLNYYKIHKKSYIALIVIGLLYLGNNLAGNLFVILRDLNNTPYSSIEKQIDSCVPDNTTVFSLFNFWYPLKNNNVYTYRTRDTKWAELGVSNWKYAAEIQEVDYIVVSDYMVNEKAPTVGREVTVGWKKKNNFEYYSILKNICKNRGELLKTIKTIGYSDIEIWKIVDRE